MKKFCKYCGKELSGEEKCPCQSDTKKELKDNKKVKEKKTTDLQKATETIKTEVSDSGKRYAKQLWNTIQNVFVKPKETLQDFVKNDDSTLTFIILILTSITIGICAVSFLKGMYYGINQLYSYYPVHNEHIWDISYFKVLMCIALGVFLSHLLLAVIFDLGFEKISKISLSFKSALSSIAISILEPTILCVFGAILTIFSYKLAFILVIYASVLYLINLYQTFGELRNVKSTHYNHLFTILILIFSFLAIYLIPKLFL